ncbi:MAG: DUF433 domain-containing protein [Lamprobacter sp.]|uniref:DUF433 domain-containing protein n=1 Tax=Lamprobacter sp. TaxID=3100796 RepID=UPI002B26420F|nr:DUF433 domain-containing protein [Lamprobacter sp.]MEA3639461.1 DUF433 domain-containing protein [Lamprobacter sp.]
MTFNMDLNDRIQIDPGICHGKPVIRDTRVPISVIIGSLAAGMDLAEIKAEYGVTAEDIQAALNFANDLIVQESFHNLPRVA